MIELILYPLIYIGSINITIVIYLVDIPFLMKYIVLLDICLWGVDIFTIYITHGSYILHTQIKFVIHYQYIFLIN